MLVKVDLFGASKPLESAIPVENKLGITAIKAVFDFGFDFVDGVRKSREDGKVTRMDFFNFLPAIRSAMPAINQIEDFDNQILDLTDQEKFEILDYARIKLDNVGISDDQVREIINDSISFVLTGVMLGNKIDEYLA